MLYSSQLHNYDSDHRAWPSTRNSAELPAFVVTIFYFCAFEAPIVAHKKVKIDTTKPNAYIVPVRVNISWENVKVLEDWHKFFSNYIIFSGENFVQDWISPLVLSSWTKWYWEVLWEHCVLKHNFII